MQSTLSASGERRSVPSQTAGIVARNKVADVEITLDSDTGNRAWVSWSYDGHRLHFFTTLPALEVEQGRTLRGARRFAIVYRNRIVAPGEAAAPTRYLDAASNNSRFHLDQVRAIVARDGLIAKAYANRTDRLAREAREAREASETDLAYSKCQAGEALYDALVLAEAEIHNPGAARHRGIDIVAVIEAALAKARGRS